MVRTWASLGNTKSNNPQTLYKNVTVLFIINKSLVLSSWGFPFCTQACFHEYYNIPVSVIEAPDRPPYFAEGGKDLTDTFPRPGCTQRLHFPTTFAFRFGSRCQWNASGHLVYLFLIGPIKSPGAVSSLFLLRKWRQKWPRFAIRQMPISQSLLGRNLPRRDSWCTEDLNKVRNKVLWLMYRLLRCGGGLDTAGFINCPNTLSLSFLIRSRGNLIFISEWWEINEIVH